MKRFVMLAVLTLGLLPVVSLGGWEVAAAQGQSQSEAHSSAVTGLTPTLDGPGIDPALPAATTAADIVIQPGEVGDGYLLVSSGEALVHGTTWRLHTFRRSGKLASLVEPGGVLFVRSLALIAPNVDAANREYDETVAELEKDLEAAGSPGIGSRSWAGIAWGDGPFDPSVKLVLFQDGRTVGYVVTSSFDPPQGLDDVVPFASIMAARAVR